MKRACFAKLETHHPKSTVWVRNGTQRTIVSGVLGGILSLDLLNYDVQELSVPAPGSDSVTLAWEENPDPRVTGYRIYYGVVSGNYTNSVRVGKETTNNVTGLSRGVGYFFAVTSVGIVTNGDAVLELESRFSNEVSVSLEPPTPQASVAANRRAVLTVKGKIGHTYEILASTNLTTWSVIGTVTLGASGVVKFIDPTFSDFPHRFYRAARLPLRERGKDRQLDPSR